MCGGGGGHLGIHTGIHKHTHEINLLDVCIDSDMKTPDIFLKLLLNVAPADCRLQSHTY